jgi:alpha-amylase
MSVSLLAGNYGILVNGTTYFAGQDAGEFEGFQQYLAHVQVSSGDQLQLYDAENQAAWAVDLSTWSVAGFTRDGNHYNATVSGCYDFYIKLKWEQDELYIGNGSNCGEGENLQDIYMGSVPRQCEAVLMQAFYNESYSPTSPGVSEYGDTKWTTLTPQAAELGRYFDYIWLPPSAYGDGAGYHPMQYSNQNSNWGTRAELDTLISALHNAGAKVVADIVINHCANRSTWCDFYTMDFGEYGVFYPDETYICSNDEVNASWNQPTAENPGSGACWGTASGSPDDGDNWDGARDWSHDKVYVQQMFIAYLQWMRDVMHYDGFRYDKGDGFNNWHHWNYNRHARPEIAFMESYNGDDRIIEEIEQSNRDLMALDFQTKWRAFDGIAAFDYSKCQGSGLLGRGYSRYAVTFIESHDWFLRPDNNNEFGGRGNSMTPALKDRLMQANAFLLGMPGVPCVFYPHWQKYKADLKPMIDARKLAGIHSESPVSNEEATQTGYQCTIQGKYGWLVLQLGDKTTHTGWGDPAYQLKASGPGYAMWVNRTAPMPDTTAVDEVKGERTKVKAEKFIQNGQLYIRCGEQVYDVMGQIIR